MVMLVITLAGFVLASALGVRPAWAAAAGAAVLAVRALARGCTTPGAVLQAANLPFLAFVLALSIVVGAVVDNGQSGALGKVVPMDGSLLGLLVLAALAAVLANAINNLPAVWCCCPWPHPPGPVRSGAEPLIIARDGDLAHLGPPRVTHQIWGCWRHHVRTNSTNSPPDSSTRRAWRIHAGWHSRG